MCYASSKWNFYHSLVQDIRSRQHFPQLLLYRHYIFRGHLGFIQCIRAFMALNLPCLPHSKYILTRSRVKVGGKESYSGASGSYTLANFYINLCLPCFFASSYSSSSPPTSATYKTGFLDNLSVGASWCCG